MRFSAALGTARIHADLGRYTAAIDELEALQETLRWVDVCLDHPGDAYMRERRADVAWYLTLTRERARGVDDLPGLLQASEEEGDTPDAVVSRLEGAVTRHDYIGATQLLGQLPAPMQQAAAPVAPDIAAHAAADQLVADLRTRALGAAESKP